MEETIKYFQPDITDIRVGYEIESYERSIDEAGDPKLNYDRWVKKILDKNDVQNILKYGMRSVRVPYLTKEQIEAEGWKEDTTFFKNKFEKTIDENLYYSLSLNDNYRIVITRLDTGGMLWRLEPFYSGECKDINTFRYICKLLGI